MPIPTKLDHCVIHVTDWERSNAFYATVLGAEVVSRSVGYAYRFGDKQLNVHGPGVKPAEVARLPVAPGNSDLCFEWMGRSRMRSHTSAAATFASKAARCSALAPRGPARAFISATPMAR